MATSTINIIIICVTLIILAELGYRNRRRREETRWGALFRQKAVDKKDIGSQGGR